MHQPDSKIGQSLKIWHECVVGRDIERLGQIIADDAVFRSPFLWKSKKGVEILKIVLKSANMVFEEFQYHRTLANEDSVVLEFSAHIGEIQLKGIDLIRFNEHGQIVELEVMVRPFKGLQALGEAMTRQMTANGDIEAFLQA